MDRGIPKVVPTSKLTFGTFAILWHADDPGYEASLWRLASALFDPIPLFLPPDANKEKRNIILDLRRKLMVGEWLQAAVSSTIEGILLDNTISSLAKIFALLSGNQIEKACNQAMDSGNLRLATLISQIGGDTRFRSDIMKQLEAWRQDAVDVWIDEDYQRIFALLSGQVQTLQASKSPDPFQQADNIKICQGLDWKRAFALHLFYGSRLEAPLSHAVESYENQAKYESPDSTALPLPWYVEPSSLKIHLAHRWRGGELMQDGLFEMLKLFVNDKRPFDYVLLPRTHGASPMDNRIPWHVYMVLNKAKPQRDPKPPPRSRFVFDAKVLGDILTTNYAMQLEYLGMPEHAAYVLLHLGNPRR